MLGYVSFGFYGRGLDIGEYRLLVSLCLGEKMGLLR